MSFTDFTQYQAPGVLIQEDTTPLVPAIGIAPSVVAIVGPSRGYKTFTDSVVLTGTTPVSLSQLGISPASVVVTNPNGNPYVNNTDYVLAVGPGADGLIGTTADNTLTIAKPATGSSITDGSVVWVSYQYTDLTFFTPQRFTNIADVVAAFGQPINLATGVILNPLSLAASIAFSNGATQVVLLSTTDPVAAATRAGLSAAYPKLSVLPDLNMVIPLPVGITGTAAAPGDVNNIGTDLKSYLGTAATQALYLTGIIGYESTVTVGPDTTAGIIADRRTMLAWPYGLFYFDGQLNQNIPVSGYYLAAAYAGTLARLPSQWPLTKKQIRGFSGVPPSVLAQMTKSYKDTLSSHGVAVSEVTRSGQLVCRHGVSTDVSSVLNREFSLVRAKDTMVNVLQDTLNSAGLIGTPIDSNTVVNLKTVVQGVLERLKSNITIVDYIGLGVRQSSADPTRMEVRFQYKPAYPLNYIVVLFSVDMTSGAVSTSGTPAPISGGTGNLNP